MLSGIYPPAVFASTSQPVFAAVTAIAKLTLVFPFFAFGTAFLLHAINGPMALLISEVFFHRTPISPVISVSILPLALFAPILHPIFAVAILVILTLVFLFFTFTASLHLCFSVYAFAF